MKYFLLALVLMIAGSANAQDQNFTRWVAQFKQQAARQGISHSTLESAFRDIKFLPRVIELDQKQPEKKLSFAEYRERIVSKQRVEQGRHEFRKHRNLLNKIGQKYGVQPQYIVALWGIETNYGSNTGGFDVIDSLATLAYEGRRRAFFSDELIKALTIIDQGHIPARAMKGSWAGAMGQSQFMPSSFLNFAQDYNGDGKKDIWGTQADVFASAANYLAQSGWKTGERWGRQVKAGKPVPESRNDRTLKRSMAQLAAEGITLPDGSPLPQTDMSAGLIAPDYPEAPFYMTYDNFDVIMKWNRSIYFATSVGLLADAIAAGQ